MNNCPLPLSEGTGVSEGTGAIRVLILGEALGENEQQDGGKPFRPWGAAGAVLERAIRRCGFSREQFVLFNAIPTRPFKNYIAPGAEGAAIAWGRPYVEAVINEYKPRVVLALGGTALKAATGLAGEKMGISDLRGWPLPSIWPDIDVVGSFHPAFLRRGAMALMSVLMHDLKLAVAVARRDVFVKFHSPVLNRDFVYEGWVPRRLNEADPPRAYVTHPNEADAWAYYERLRENKGWVIAYDIETPRSGETAEDETDELAETAITSIQFSGRVGEGIFMPWREPYVHVAKAILGLPNAKAGANTWRFDDPLLEVHGARIAGVRHDIRWAFKALQPDLRGGLQFISSFYCAGRVGWGPWKHQHLQFPEAYGIRDVDAIQQILAR